MRFTKFIIKNYRAITGPLEIDVDRRALIPIIGINESGKTTILQAIFALDFYNDDLNESGRHLKDTSNLYRTSSPPATIEAQVEATRKEVLAAIEDADEEDVKAYAATMKKWPRFPNPIRIVRNLKSLSYTMPGFPSQEKENAIAKSLIRQLPYILYFDDFRDKVDEKIEIVDSKKSSPGGWLAIMEQLFKQTERGLSVFSLPSLEDRQRKSVLAKVQRHLNQTLTREWEHFRLDDREALEIAIDFVQETAQNNVNRNFVRLDVVETDATGDRHFFFVSDRSKGFFWFFNFVMKLEFNPKVISQDDRNTIYLLDEPGSYLHASAQIKLCDKLVNLSQRNRVLYCTHSHYLLSPEKIPLGNIFVAGKDGSGSINLIPVHQFKGNVTETRSAFQPLADALRIRPFALDTLEGPVIITEGIYDYFALELLKGSRSIRVLPSVGADSIKFYVSLMITWSVPFVALWDNDSAGRKHKAEAVTKFSDELASDHFFLIPLVGNQRNRILQDLFNGIDLRMFRTELAISTDTSFEKTLVTLFYSPKRADILAKISAQTKANFDQLLESVGF